MLSDEEMLEIFKKEVEKEQNEYEQVNEYTKFCYNNHKFILNLIEKQSKEIEELKKYKEGYKLLSYSLDNYISKDKIKAKIEEIENTGIDVAWEQINYTIREQDRAKIQVLQSLLEKE